MTMIDVVPATWDGVDGMLAELQKELRAGTLGGKVLSDVLTQIRMDLAVLRAVERAQHGTPVEPAEPVVGKDVPWIADLEP